VRGDARWTFGGEFGRDKFLGCEPIHFCGAWVAHGSRALVAASRRNRLSRECIEGDFCSQKTQQPKVRGGETPPPTRRGVRYPETPNSIPQRNDLAKGRIMGLVLTIQR
jgi:hypothetical protein